MTDDLINHEQEMPDAPSSKPATVVYACSGFSDAGELADHIARQLARDGMAEMSCLAGIGGRVKNLVAKAEKAERILVIDGCSLNCAPTRSAWPAFRSLNTLNCIKSACAKVPAR